MRCMYCGQDNPDGAVYCKCGRPISLGGGYGTGGGYGAPQMNPFPMQTLDQVKRKRAVPVLPIIVVLLILIGVGGVFGYKMMMEKSMTDSSMWKAVSGDGYSITVPKAMKKGEMLSLPSNDAKLLDFYTSQEAGFDVSLYSYTAEEKKLLGKMDAKDYLTLYQTSGRTTKINGQELIYAVRDGKNYVYAGINRHNANYIGKSDDLYYIEAVFPYADGYYQVDVYCAETDKSKYEDIMLEWLDSFEIK